MRKHIGFGLVNGTDTVSTAGHAPQVSISINNDLLDRGAADDTVR